MKKIFYLFFIIFLLFNPVFAATEKQFLTPDILRNEKQFIEENENIKKCRNALFSQNFEYKINIDKFKKYFISPNKNKLKFIIYYSDGSYKWLRLFKNYDFIYSKDGYLKYIEFCGYIKEFGYSSFFYNKNGVLTYLIIQLNQKENRKEFYCFDKNKNFLGIVDDYKFYNKTGDIIFEKKDFKPFN